MFQIRCSMFNVRCSLFSFSVFSFQHFAPRCPTGTCATLAHRMGEGLGVRVLAEVRVCAWLGEGMICLLAGIEKPVQSLLPRCHLQHPQPLTLLNLFHEPPRRSHHCPLARLLAKPQILHNRPVIRPSFQLLETHPGQHRRPVREPDAIPRQMRVHITDLILNKPTLSFQIRYGKQKYRENTGPELKQPVANKRLTRFEFMLRIAP